MKIHYWLNFQMFSAITTYFIIVISFMPKWKIFEVDFKMNHDKWNWCFLTMTKWKRFQNPFLIMRLPFWEIKSNLSFLWLHLLEHSISGLNCHLFCEIDNAWTFATRLRTHHTIERKCGKLDEFSRMKFFSLLCKCL